MAINKLLVNQNKLFDTNNVDLVLDVGANRGQYGTNLREMGFKGRIISFEPLEPAFSKLSNCAKNDSNWEAHNFALGKKNSTSVINISENSVSSSFLDLTQRVLMAAPEVKYIDSQEITIRTLDNVISELNLSGERIFVKLDTQGYEAAILKGAKKSIKNIVGFQLEMSLFTLYKGEKLFPYFLKWMNKRNYELKLIIPGFSDPNTGCQLQIDGIFFRDLA